MDVRLGELISCSNETDTKKKGSLKQKQKRVQKIMPPVELVNLN